MQLMDAHKRTQDSSFKTGDDAMAQTMIASVQDAVMTDGQIDTAVDQLRAALRKQRSTIKKDVAQKVLGLDNLGMMLFAPFRQQAEMMSNIIVRRAKANRTRTPQAMLDATGRKQYTDKKVVAAMPRGEGQEETDVFFFKPRPEEYDHDGWMSDEALDRAFEVRGLKAADPYSLGALNEADPAFADEHPNGTHWKDAQGKWCFTAFNRWDGKRCVYVNRDGRGWRARWFFAGVRK